MGIHHDPRRGEIIQLAHHFQRQTPLRRDAFFSEIAKVLAQYGAVAAQQTEGIFEIGPHRQYGRQRRKARRQCNGVRDIATGPAHHFAALAHHRIVHALINIAVMQQPAVGDVRQLVQRLLIGDGGRSAVQIAGGHNQRRAKRL